MTNRETYICHNYSEAVFQRAQKPMEPLGFEPNWKDQPSRYTIYRDVERIPLLIQPPKRLATVAEILQRLATLGNSVGDLTFDELSTILLIAHSVLTRRLGVNWNRDNRDRSRYHMTTYGRGTASGGGMYPTEIYWASGGQGPLLPGIYHYDNAHHALARLHTGDVTPSIREATFQQGLTATTDQYLLIALNFWKNAFKYNSFSYHVVTQDLGALLGSLRLMAKGFGSDLPFLFWYRDVEINQLLGLDTLSESAFVVIPLPTAQQHVCAHEKAIAADHQAADLENRGQPQMNRASFQRSKKIIRFPQIEEVHQSALIQEEPRPATSKAMHASCRLLPTDGEPIVLPEPALELLQEDIIDVFRKRRSSFGRFSNHKPLSLTELATMLYYGAAARNYTSDVKEEDGTTHFTRLMVFVNNVEGVERGAYAYDYERHCLWAVHKGDLTAFLQANYFLQNYNMQETGVVIAIVGRVASMLEVYGNRGYRILNAEVGLVAQHLYIVSAALSFGCGAVLGFDNVNLNTMLGLDGSDHKSILFLLAGHERAYMADFEERFV